MEGRVDPAFNHPIYEQLLAKLKMGRIVVPFGEIIDSISGGATPLRSDEDQYTDSGIKFLRIQNITATGFDLSDVKYITETVYNNLLNRSRLRKNDLLMTITGRIGTCAIVNDDILPANINQHIVRIRLKAGINPYYVASYFNSNIGSHLSNRGVTGTTRIALDYEAIKAIPIPIVSKPEEDSLINIERNGVLAKSKKLQQADKLVEDAKEAVLSAVGITFSEYNASLFSAQRLKEVRDYGLYCNTHSAYLNHVFHILKSQPACVELSEYIEVNPTTVRTELSDDTLVSFVPMPAVEEFCNSAVYTQRPYEEVKTGFTIFKRGDLLWAKITPCMQNGKSFIAADMPTEIGFGSTEFHVLRIKEGCEKKIYMPYLWAILSEKHILEAAQGMFSGSAGQQRVPETFLKRFPLVLPDYDTQRKAADTVLDALKQASVLKAQAEQEWQNAKEQFEKELLGGSNT